MILNDLKREIEEEDRLVCITSSDRKETRYSTQPNTTVEPRVKDQDAFDNVDYSI